MTIRRYSTIILVGALALSADAWAESGGHTSQQGPATAAVGTEAAGLTGEPVDQILRRRQDQLLKMHELSHRIQDAKDDKERQALKDEQLQLMKEQLHDIREQRMLMKQHDQAHRRKSGNTSHASKTPASRDTSP